ncbi:LuxR C-terminal-related transcriptional regulator [Cryptosporangium aurantiacum]|uniref:LuxR family transcriptional regulator, maltose regulon positive regulatory protein n=1 Tax=Cryptosporangium aurantiacum TaxID=134849 RepID=A0A1M7R131_9ACTN|nr:LuxR C-terminal-related transcriptional regulator [Cryptosporangium aurantiacum]SHN38456.1 LuxR family transcriptional regulator, maltose regulon positive regulatory protein [Cryptosporangium aurantiacum]
MDGSGQALRPNTRRASVVRRARLADRLDPGPGRRLTVVVAPAGYGKTTLLGTWAGTRERVGWLTLDERDNEENRFLTSLIGALRQGSGDDELGKGVLAALRSPDLRHPDALIGALLADLERLPEPVDVVLDDYHVITGDAVHRACVFLVEHAPEHLHLIVSGRVDPPLPLARWRVRGELVRLGADDLAFTVPEAAAFVRDVMRLELARQDLVRLHEKTEGWVAGLQIAALSLRGRTSPAEFVASFSGRHRDVFDFLGEEVLDRQPAEVRRFLVETSILDQLSGPLCDAVTGRTDGQETLERLERENLFVVALDDERRWYRYHHLFADFLRLEPDRARPGPDRGELHARASRWCEANGALPDAIGHAISAADHDRAIGLILAGADAAWSRGEVPTVLGWIEALPADVREQQPRLVLQQALALALTGKPDRAQRLAESVRGEEPLLAGFSAAVRSWCARLRGDLHPAIDLARQALTLLPADRGGLRVFAADSLGDSLWSLGDLPAAETALTDAAAIGTDAGHVYGTLSALTLLARVQSERGRLGRAHATLLRAERYALQQDMGASSATAALHLGLAALQYERDDLDAAEVAFRTGVESAERTGNVTDLTWGLVGLSRLEQARHRPDAALATALRAERVARDYGANPEAVVAAAWMVRLRLLRDELPEAAAAEQTLARHAEAGTPGAEIPGRLAAARLSLARGRSRDALRLLRPLRDAAQAAGRGRDLLEILVVQALASEPDEAAATLADALARAAPEHYVRTFVDEGPALAALLPRVDGAEELRAAFERQQAVPPEPALAEPMTDRESDVLRLLAAGKTNREIAAELFVSVGTVKTHLNNLYRKLGAHSRTQALARARALNLPSISTFR